jgi:hypothetical protein
MYALREEEDAWMDGWMDGWSVGSLILSQLKRF